MPRRLQLITPLIGPKGENGDDGATFIPSVSEDGVLSWSNDKGLPNPSSINIKGPRGEPGSSSGSSGVHVGPDAPTDSAINVWIDTDDGETVNLVEAPATANVGQTIVVKAVDENGAPTEWEAATLPDKLPNPNALTFTGAATGTYDGSAPLTVEIPAGGGGGGNVVEILNLTIAEETQYVFHPFSFELYDVVFMKIVQTENAQAYFSFNDDIIYFITSQPLHNHADLTIFQIDKERAFVVYNSGYVPPHPNGVSNAAGNTFKGGMTFDPVKTGLKIFKASKWKTGDNIRIWGRLKA